MIHAVLGAAAMAVFLVALYLARPWLLVQKLSARQQSRKELKAALITIGHTADAQKTLQNAIVEIKQQLLAEQRKASEYFDRISEVLVERDRWKSLYYQQAAEHGAAQDMLLREREQNARSLLALGKQPYLDDRIEAVVREFRDHHSDAFSAERERVEREAAELLRRTSTTSTSEGR